jgi:carboxymethylenebutenolidase
MLTTSIQSHMVETFHAGGKGIRMDVHAVASSAGNPKPAIVLLHGAGGNIGFWIERFAPVLSSAGITLFAPHYFERTNTLRADVETIMDGVHVPKWLDTIAIAREVIAERSNVDSQRIAFVGISLGAFLSMSLAAIDSSLDIPGDRRAIRCLVEISGGLAEPYASLATPNLPPTLILHGDADTVVPVSHAHNLDSLLTRLGVEHETRILHGEGHWFGPAGQMQLLMHAAAFLNRYLR